MTVSVFNVSFAHSFVRCSCITQSTTSFFLLFVTIPSIFAKLIFFLSSIQTHSHSLLLTTLHSPSTYMTDSRNRLTTQAKSFFSSPLTIVYITTNIIAISTIHFTSLDRTTGKHEYGSSDFRQLPKAQLQWRRLLTVRGDMTFGNCRKSIAESQYCQIHATRTTFQPN
jgi:hypothetical protein